MLRGKLKDISLISLIQMFYQDGKSGKLTIHQDNFVIGEIYFSEGNIVWAGKGNLTGEKAFYQLINVEEGDFIFEQNKMPENRNITVSCEYLLLEASRKRDEFKQRQNNIIKKIKQKYSSITDISFSFMYKEIFKTFTSIAELVDSGEINYIWFDNGKEVIMGLPFENSILEIRFNDKVYPEEVYQTISKILREG